MKKVLLLAMLVCVFNGARAQKIQFGNPTNKWHFIDSTIGCCIPAPIMYTTAYYDSSEADFVYGGQSYKYMITSIGTALMRQAGNKVYVLDYRDSLERLVYDFDLGLHDTIFTNYPENKYIAWVASIDSTQLMGQWYKVWHFEGLDSVLYYPDSAYAISYNVIEGIGCTNGTYYPANPYIRSAFSQQLLCFDNNMSISSGLSNPVVAYGYDYFTYYDNDSSCITFYADHGGGSGMYNEGVADIAKAANNAIVVPNPVNNSSKIVLPYKMADGTVTIINQIGRVVATVPVINQVEVTIGTLIDAAGIYYYRVTDAQTGRVFAGKFIH